MTPSLMSSVDHVRERRAAWAGMRERRRTWAGRRRSGATCARSGRRPPCSPCRSIAWPLAGLGVRRLDRARTSSPAGSPAGLPIDGSPNTKVTTSVLAVELITTSTRRSEGSWPVLRLDRAGRRRAGGCRGGRGRGRGRRGGLAVAGAAVAEATADGRAAADGADEGVTGEVVGDGLVGVVPHAATTIAARPATMERRIRACMAIRLPRSANCFAAAVGCCASCLPRREDAVVRRDEVVPERVASRPWRSASQAAVMRTHSGALRRRGAPGGARNGESVSTRTRSCGARAAMADASSPAGTRAPRS